MKGKADTSKNDEDRLRASGGAGKRKKAAAASGAVKGKKAAAASDAGKGKKAAAASDAGKGKGKEAAAASDAGKGKEAAAASDAGKGKEAAAASGPKRYPSAFFLFFSELKEQRPGNESNLELTKAAAGSGVPCQIKRGNHIRTNLLS